MKKLVVLIAFVLLAGLVAAASSPAKDKGVSGRLLTGRVVNNQDAPVTQAVVYLSNARNRAVKTYIVGPDGTYRFPALAPNTDYEVYAEFNGKKSDTKTVSQFDDRPQVNINLKIDTR
jgi:hypothetical protein